jgi:hypothetical protein
MPRAAANEATLDQFIEALFNTVKSKDAKFGISTTMRQFDQTQTNAKKWLQSGWCHYFMPELYTSDQEKFQNTLDRWVALNTPELPFEKPQIVPVLYTTAVEVGDMSGHQWDASDIVEQVKKVRDKKLGQAFFTARSLRSPDQGGPPRPKHDVSDKIKKDHYQTPAPIPPVAAPGGTLKVPKIEKEIDAVYVSVPGTRVAYFLLWRDNGQGWEAPEKIGRKGQIEYGPRRIRVEAYDRHGRKSDPIETNLP